MGEPWAVRAQANLRTGKIGDPFFVPPCNSRGERPWAGRPWYGRCKILGKGGTGFQPVNGHGQDAHGTGEI